MKSYDGNRVDFYETGCNDGPLYSETIPTILSYAQRAPAPLEYAIEPFSYGVLLSVGLAAALFSVSWVVGWLCAGFTRD
jgi:hypothetical protein